MSEIAKAISEALNAWRVYLITRQAAYERKRDKGMRKAIDVSEKLIMRIKEIDIKDKEIDSLILKFFKYNN